MDISSVISGEGLVLAKVHDQVTNSSNWQLHLAIGNIQLHLAISNKQLHLAIGNIQLLTGNWQYTTSD